MNADFYFRTKETVKYNSSVHKVMKMIRLPIIPVSDISLWANWKRICKKVATTRASVPSLKREITLTHSSDECER